MPELRDTAVREVAIPSALFDLARGRQALLSVAQPALGACIALGRVPDPRVVVVGLVAATAGFLAVFSLNDVLDARVDELSLAAGKDAAPDDDVDTITLRHPLAQGAVSRTVALTWVASLATIALVGAAALGPACVLAFAVAVALEVLYCSLRSTTWTKTFVSGAMVGVGGLAGWVAVAPLSAWAVPFFLLLALWEIAGRNIPNDLADIEADCAVGIRSVPTTFGPAAAAASVLAGALAATAVCAALPVSLPERAIAAGLAVWSMVVPAFGLVREPTPARAGAYFNLASTFPALVFAGFLAALLLGW